jgi:hypothetical protein
MWPILNIAFYVGWLIIFGLAWVAVQSYLPNKVEAIRPLLAESRKELEIAESKNLELNIVHPFYMGRIDDGLWGLRQRIDLSERELLKWSSRKLKWLTRLILVLMITAGVGFIGGKPDPITWHSARTIDLACLDIYELPTQLPANWSPGIDYLSSSPQPLSDTLLRLENRISDAATNNPNQYKYLAGELALLENSLTNGSLGADLPIGFSGEELHNPSDIVQLNMEPFCQARRG